MPYITNKKRNKLVKSVGQSYALRKTLITITVASLILICVFAALSLYYYSDTTQKFWANIDESWSPQRTFQELINAQSNATLSIFKATWSEGNTVLTIGLSGFGIGICVWIGITIGLGIWALVLILMMKSPKQVRKNMSTLQGAALSGKKLAPHANATQVYRERATNTKKLKKGKVSK